MGLNVRRFARRLAACLALALVVTLHSQRDGDWLVYGRDAGGERFSPLNDINRDNVSSLQVAWTFRTGDAYQPERGRPTAFEATPLHVDGTLYLSTPVGRVIALDSATGRATLGVRREGAAKRGLRRLREPRRVDVAKRKRAAHLSSPPSTPV